MISSRVSYHLISVVFLDDSARKRIDITNYNSMSAYVVMPDRNFWGRLIYLVLASLIRECSSNPSQCQSLEYLRNRTNELNLQFTELSCQTITLDVDTCIGMDCVAQNGSLISPLVYGLSFENFCSTNSSFQFYWSFDMEKRANVDDIFIPGKNISVSDSKNSEGRKIAEKIILRMKLITDREDEFIVQIKISLSVSSEVTFELIPAHDLTISKCPKAQNIMTPYEVFTMAPVVMTTISRFNTGRSCIADEMGNCKQNEICRPIKNGSYFCHCFDGFEVNARDVCTSTATSDKPYRYLWAIVGGVPLTIILVVLFVVILRKVCRRTIRYDEFDLSNQSVLSVDPPMIEA